MARARRSRRQAYNHIPNLGEEDWPWMGVIATGLLMRCGLIILVPLLALACEPDRGGAGSVRNVWLADAGDDGGIESDSTTAQDAAEIEHAEDARVLTDL